ncbi:S8 family peptidase, partial [Micromonospora sp. SL1-18]
SVPARRFLAVGFVAVVSAAAVGVGTAASAAPAEGAIRVAVGAPVAGSYIVVLKDGTADRVAALAAGHG